MSNKIEVIFSKDASIDGKLYKKGDTALIPEVIGAVYLRTNKCYLVGTKPQPKVEVKETPKKVVKKTTKK